MTPGGLSAKADTLSARPHRRSQNYSSYLFSCVFVRTTASVYPIRAVRFGCTEREFIRAMVLAIKAPVSLSRGVIEKSGLEQALFERD